MNSLLITTQCVKPFAECNVDKHNCIFICSLEMRENFIYFMTHCADKVIGMSGLVIYKVTTFMGMILLFLSSRKNQEKEDYKVTIEKEKL